MTENDIQIKEALVAKRGRYEKALEQMKSDKWGDSDPAAILLEDEVNAALAVARTAVTNHFENERKAAVIALQALEAQYQ